MKPSNRIAEIANRHIPKLSIEGPSMWDLMSAIMEYLDEEHEKNNQ